MYKIPEKLKSKYEFVTLVAKRAEQLQMGAPPRVELDTNKVTVMAQAEVATGAVKAIDPDAELPVEEAEEE
jgi:DNA-directed RNA polymerase omega subunit